MKHRIQKWGTNLTWPALVCLAGVFAYAYQHVPSKDAVRAQIQTVNVKTVHNRESIQLIRDDINQRFETMEKHQKTIINILRKLK